MNKIALTMTVLALTAGAAFAENPYVGQPPAMTAQDKVFRQLGNTPLASIDGSVDYTAPAAIRQSAPVDQNGSAHRFGDASPSSYRN